MRLQEPGILSPRQAVAQFRRWYREASRGEQEASRLAAFVGDWAALEAAERILREGAGGISVHVSAVNRALLQALPEAEAWAEKEKSPPGQEEVRTVLQETWKRWLQELPLTAEVEVLKHVELVVAYRLDWAEVVRRTAFQPILLLLPGGWEEGRGVTFPGFGHPWPLELLSEASTWMISDVSR
jgi:hypothetical protein